MVQTAEDVVVQKLRWYSRAKREKDLADVVDVLDAQHGQLDMGYLRRWCNEHGTAELLDQAMAAAQDR